LCVDLIDPLDGYEAHGRPLHGLGNRSSIVGIIFLPIEIGLDELGWHDARIMALFDQLSRKLLATRASFHPNHRRWCVGEEPDKSQARELLSENRLAGAIAAAYVEKRLADIDAVNSTVLLY